MNGAAFQKIPEIQENPRKYLKIPEIFTISRNYDENTILNK